jgi:hypothetical protein
MKHKAIAEKVFVSLYPDYADWFDVYWDAVSDIEEVKSVSSNTQVANALGISAQEISDIAFEMYKVTLVEKLVFEKFHSLAVTNRKEFMDKFEEVGKQVSVPQKTRANLIGVIQKLSDDLLSPRETTANLGVAEGKPHKQKLKEYAGRKLKADIDYEKGAIYIFVKEIDESFLVSKRYPAIIKWLLERNRVSWTDALIIFPRWAKGTKKLPTDLLANVVSKGNSEIEEGTGRKLLVILNIPKDNYRCCYAFNEKEFELGGELITRWKSAKNIYEEACQFYELGKYEDAKSKLQNALSLTPSYMEAHLMLIRTYGMSAKPPLKAELENLRAFLPEQKKHLDGALKCLRNNMTEGANALWNSQQAVDAAVSIEVEIERIDHVLEILDALWEQKESGLSEKEKREMQLAKKIQIIHETYKKENISDIERNKIIEDFTNEAKSILENIAGRLNPGWKVRFEEKTDRDKEILHIASFLLEKEFWEDYEPLSGITFSSLGNFLADFNVKFCNYIRTQDPDYAKERIFSHVSPEDAEEMRAKKDRTRPDYDDESEN